MKPIIYVDLDGVLVDLFNHIGFFHKTPYTNLTKEQMEEFFRSTDAYLLFRDAPAFKNANEILQMVVDLFGGYRILSSPLSIDKANSILGKKEWIKNHITVPFDKCIFEHDKYLYATQEDGSPNVLIDDFRVNIQRWNAAGGIGIKFQNDENTFSELQTQLLLLAMDY